jgi:hypothetical protein
VITPIALTSDEEKKQPLKGQKEKETYGAAEAAP